MILQGDCLTTAMGIMPHKSVQKALDLAFLLDIPFWPQLPRRSFYEDMYVQISENFPGVTVDFEQQDIHFCSEDFQGQLPELVAHWDDLDYFRLSEQYSDTFSAFLRRDLGFHPHVRGQVIGPVSFGLRVIDEEGRPIIYRPEVKEFLFPFIRKKLMAQRHELASRHPSPVVWIDEPGLESLFSAFTGYTDAEALEDYGEFLDGIEPPRGLHLCGNPDWSFLFGLDVEVLSVDALANGHVMVRYFDQIRDFIRRGGVMCWGITPTLQEEMQGADAHDLLQQLVSLWQYLDERGLPESQIARQSWLAPARCCLLNPQGDDSVDQSIEMVRRIAHLLREKYGIG